MRQRRHPHRIDRQDEEAAFGVEQLAAIGKQGREMILEPPQFARRAAPELGRVEQDAVVAAFAADFARGELGGVVDDPADRAVAHPRQHGVGAAALDRLLRGVDVDHLRARVGQRQRADAGIAEQVEHLRVGRPFPHEIPLRGHVGEEAQVAEGRQAGVEADVAARQRPRRRDRAMLDPASAALLVRSRHEGRVGGPFLERGGPHRLRFGANHGDIAIAFPFLAVPAVDQAPVGPRLGDDRLEVGEAHAASAILPPIAALARGPDSIACPAARAAAASMARSSASISSRVTMRPKISIERAIESARPCGVSRLISSPASICARARFTSASVRSSAACATQSRASASASAARALSVDRLTPNSPVSAKPCVQA